MVQIFGQFDDTKSNSQEYLILGFSPTSIPLQQRWRNNGLSADFLADYLTTFFPVIDTEPTTFKKRKEIRGAISYIANELLENAMKFNDTNSQYPIGIQFRLYSEQLILYTTNSVQHENVERFQSFLQELLQTEPQELYIRQIERAQENDNVEASGLGLLTMIDDYQVNIGWKFETVQQDNEEVVIVTTMVRLDI
ncbi:MAG: ATP-binding protein [Candidatus Parabeggiatoa sp.]|nr:ATP-binding protein [Candidatus Parabeggiatoa sp.]